MKHTPTPEEIFKLLERVRKQFDRIINTMDDRLLSNSDQAVQSLANKLISTVESTLILKPDSIQQPNPSVPKPITKPGSNKPDSNQSDSKQLELLEDKRISNLVENIWWNFVDGVQSFVLEPQEQAVFKEISNIPLISGLNMYESKTVLMPVLGGDTLSYKVLTYQKNKAKPMEMSKVNLDKFSKLIPVVAREVSKLYETQFIIRNS